jgi:hypothetical protein
MAGDTTLGGLLGTPAAGYGHSIYYQSAPDSAAYPLIIFNKQSGIPTEAFTDPDALDDEIWLIKAIDHNPTADTAEAISQRCAALLNDYNLSLAGGAKHLFLRRQSDVDYQELAAGETYVHCGSLYRLVYDP